MKMNLKKGLTKQMTSVKILLNTLSVASKDEVRNSKYQGKKRRHTRVCRVFLTQRFGIYNKYLRQGLLCSTATYNPVLTDCFKESEVKYYE